MLTKYIQQPRRRYNGDHLLTTGDCGAGATMQATFNGLQFIAGSSSDCTSSNWKTCVDSDHICDVIDYDDSISGELALVHGTAITAM